MYLPCRPHIFELVLKNCLDSLMRAISGPEMLLFKRFRDIWTKLNKNVFITGIKEVPNNLRTTIHEFLEYNLSTQMQYRNDYRELLELTMIFLGSIPKNGISFHILRPKSHARWMVKAIYAFKIYLFQDPFELSNKKRNFS